MSSRGPPHPGPPLLSLPSHPPRPLPVHRNPLQYKTWRWLDHATMASSSSSTDPPSQAPPSSSTAESTPASDLTPTKEKDKMMYPEDPSFSSPYHSGRPEMAQDDIDAVLRNRRKARDPKACYACHRRKVKCDRGLPCDSCVKRDHPELCSYERPGKRRRIALVPNLAPLDNGAQSDEAEYSPHQSGHNITVPTAQWERINKELQMLREAVKGPPSDIPEETMDQEDLEGGALSRSDESEREGIHAPSDQMGTMHLGSRSVLAYMMGLGRSKSTQNAARTLLEENILPKLGLDNETASYPFVDLWSTDSTMQDVSGLCKALPDDDLCREFFVAYRDVACTIYPVVADTTAFETTLNVLLSNRHRIGGDESMIHPDRPFGVSISWLALLFAVLASGAQSTSKPAKERELTSQVYICCSYQALRMANFLTHPSLDAIQAFLIIGNVLSYNMNPGVAYIFLGMTMRMAFSIGLQADSQNFSQSEQYARSRIWWALAWQDSHFSVSYDRPTASALCSPEIPYQRSSTPGRRSYAESMFRIIRLTQEIIRERSFNPRSTMSWQTIQQYKEEVARIVADGAPHLRQREFCRKTTQHLERLALKLHSSYITSELCRPSLRDSPTPTSNPIDTSFTGTPMQSPVYGSQTRRKGSHHSTNSPSSTSTGACDSYLTAQFRHDCITNLQNTIAAYVELHSLSEFAARSWIGIQRAVSAAFLLGTLPETNQDPKIQSLLRDLEIVIEQRTMVDPAFDTGADGRSTTSPVMRAQKETSGKPPLADSPHWAKSMSGSLRALGKLNKALQQHPPRQDQQQHIMDAHSVASSNVPSWDNKWAGYVDGGMSVTGGLAMPTYPPIVNLKHEAASPGSNSGMGKIMMSTPESTASGEWTYSNIAERTSEFISPALWG